MMSQTACLFVLSACLAGVTAGEGPINDATEQPYGPEDIKISGVNVITIQVRSTFQCTAECYPPCTYTWNMDGHTINDQGLYLTAYDFKPVVFNCVAKNPDTGETASINRTVQVAGGPSDVTITAPKMLVNGEESTFVCSSECHPSCNYTMSIGDQTWKNTSTLQYITPLEAKSVTVICRAQNTVTGLFGEATSTITVAQGPSGVTIRGASSVDVGASVSYYCFANCDPTCNITWLYEGKTLPGDPVTVPIVNQGYAVLGSKVVINMQYALQTEILECTAVNPVSGKSETTIMNLNVTDPAAVLPITETQAIANFSYSLQCSGAGQESNIQWTKNGEPLVTSDSVHLANNNATLTFDPLSQFDTGTYQCIVRDQENVIPGTPYVLDVIYGPDTAVISSSSSKMLTQTTLSLLPGSSATLSCSSNCNPACTYQWTLGGKVVSSSATFSISSASVADEGILLCKASNPAVHTMADYATATVDIQLIDGPKNVTISGPSSVQVGVKATFECSAVCNPPCFYTWDVYGTTLHGSTVDLTVSQYLATETLSCTAENSVTEKVATTNTTIDITDPDWCGC